MGAAAYNRGTRAISNQIFPNDVRRTVSPAPKPVDPLPEGILRSSFMPDSDAQIFLSYENRWYVIHTRFQTMKRVRNMTTAITLFEKVEMFGRYALTDGRTK